MARFDIYRLKSGGLVVDLQATIIDNLDTRVVAPLLRLEEFPKPVERLNPKFQVDGTTCIMVTHMLGTISLRDVQETIGRLSDDDHSIVAATDFLFQGF
ncbi:CcdB family protein [Agrobacterium rosae]|uniref:Toxin CcdB n=1 Tax=Agrobacterium rosae TaxID=1972867 RepID=A0A1R3TR29_9HYPH|nr:plasmid maintenance protein CcdB [Agrobacterium rosae]